jgi:hypothetical protein
MSNVILGLSILLLLRFLFLVRKRDYSLKRKVKEKAVLSIFLGNCLILSKLMDGSVSTIHILSFVALALGSLAYFATMNEYGCIGTVRLIDSFLEQTGNRYKVTCQFEKVGKKKEEYLFHIRQKGKWRKGGYSCKLEIMEKGAEIRCFFINVSGIPGKVAYDEKKRVEKYWESSVCDYIEQHDRLKLKVLIGGYEVNVKDLYETVEPKDLLNIHK